MKRAPNKSTPLPEDTFTVSTLGTFPEREAEPKRGKILASKDLQLVILQLLVEGPKHGYEIIKAVERHSSGIYSPSPGMVYPVFTELEKLGYAISKVSGNKKCFTITNPGRKYLLSTQGRATAVLQSLKRYGYKLAHLQQDAAQEEKTIESWGGGPYAQDDKEWRQLKSDFLEIRHELKAALFSKMECSLVEKQRVLRVLRTALKEILSK